MNKLFALLLFGILTVTPGCWNRNKRYYGSCCPTECEAPCGQSYRPNLCQECGEPFVEPSYYKPIQTPTRRVSRKDESEIPAGYVRSRVTRRKLTAEEIQERKQRMGERPAPTRRITQQRMTAEEMRERKQSMEDVMLDDEMMAQTIPIDSTETEPEVPMNETRKTSRKPLTETIK